MPSPGQEESHGKRDHQNVVETCPDQIRLDFTEDGSSEIEGGDGVKEV